MSMSHNHLFVLGAQKSGTTALHNFLSRHPSIAASNPKECNYFIDARNRKSRYLDYFGCIQNKVWLLDTSPVYMLRCHQSAPAIAQSFPNSKLIAILRNPIDRFYSQYNMLVQKGRASSDFSDVLFRTDIKTQISEIEFDEKTGYPAYPVQTLLLFSEYSWQIECFLEHFTEQQLLLIRHEWLLNNHQETMDLIFDFLGLETICIDPAIIHKRMYPPLRLQQWQVLSQLLDCEIRRLEAILGCNLDEWRIFNNQVDA